MMKRIIVEGTGDVTELNGGDGYLLETSAFIHVDEEQKGTMELVITNNSAYPKACTVEFDYARIA
jgi:hypothetical protein